MTWIDVKDELPPEKKEVLGLCTNTDDDDCYWHGIVQVYFSRNTGWHRCEMYDKKSVHVTHWMPRPKLPV